MLLPTVVVLVVVAAIAVVAPPEPHPVPLPSPGRIAIEPRPAGSVLFRTDYSEPGLDARQAGWSAEQEPHFPGASGPEARDRIVVVDEDEVPGAGVYKPENGAMRVELRPYESRVGAADGDVQESGTYRANRAEVYGRVPESMGGTPAEQWPDPVGSTRWYAFSLYVPEAFETATNTDWLALTQWKGLHGGSPPLAVEIKRDGLRLGGARTNQGLVPNDGDLGALDKGEWTYIMVGIRFSTDPELGWVEVHRDGALVLPRVTMSTMDIWSGTGDDAAADPIYLKQGIYRGGDWQTTAVLFFGPTIVGTTREAVSHQRTHP